MSECIVGHISRQQRLSEREGLNDFVPEEEPESRIFEATRNKSVFLSCPEADRLEEAGQTSPP